ncbi:hypothetical protein AB1Y20_010309 [Prymnesium parvum]|uniref:PDZ domain-containing protein n=1 Tax=Prymnesium parvum TaxID=97485 RepID=A0AB34K717_PRYPA
MGEGAVADGREGEAQLHAATRQKGVVEAERDACVSTADENESKAQQEEADVVIQIMKGKHNFGINLTRNSYGVVVTTLDKGSQAEQAGVQPGDRLLRVQDIDSKLPPENPGGEVVVTAENFHQTLACVRQMRYCRFFIKSQTAAAF